jgi:hypothetical protein
VEVKERKIMLQLISVITLKKWMNSQRNKSRILLRKIIKLRTVFKNIKIAEIYMIFSFIKKQNGKKKSAAENMEYTAMRHGIGKKYSK